MTIAKDIIYGRIPDIQAYLDEGNAIDDIDEYGFTFLIECAIADRQDVAELLLKAGAQINQADFSGRTPLHWAVYHSNFKLARYFLTQGANANAYTNDGLSILVYPLLRRQEAMKHLLYQHGAKLDFALDFIHAKLLGHRYSLKGTVDILTAKGEFIEMNYEGFILEFTVALVRDALTRFITSFSTRAHRSSFPHLYPIMDAFDGAETLIQLQHFRRLDTKQVEIIEQILNQEMVILPVASQGHAIGFIRYQNWLAKIDRGEHAKIAGSANIYRITRPEAFTLDFARAFLYKRQPRAFFHETIHKQLGLLPVASLPISPQTVGNCSWANIQGLIPAGYFMQLLALGDPVHSIEHDSMHLYNAWMEWDQERALDECLQRFYQASPARKASIAAQLGAVLFQTCNATNPLDSMRAEKIVTILSLPEYAYILNSYYEVYCLDQLTRRGNNLLKVLDDCGVNPGIGINPIATGLKDQEHG